MWWCTTLVPALGSQRLSEFEATVVYLVVLGQPMLHSKTLSQKATEHPGMPCGWQGEDSTKSCPGTPASHRDTAIAPCYAIHMSGAQFNQVLPGAYGTGQSDTVMVK